MQAIPKEIIKAQALTTSLQSLFVSEAKKRTIISKVTFANRASSLATVTVHIVPANETAGNNNIVIPEQMLNANESWSAYQLEGLILEPGAKLNIKTDAAGNGLVNVAASGLEVY